MVWWRRRGGRGRWAGRARLDGPLLDHVHLRADAPLADDDLAGREELRLEQEHDLDDARLVCVLEEGHRADERRVDHGAQLAAQAGREAVGPAPCRRCSAKIVLGVTIAGGA